MTYDADAAAVERRADQAAVAGRLNEAQSLLEQAIKIEPNFFRWVKLGSVCSGSGNLRAALNAVERALAIAPLDFAALLSRASLLDRMGDESAGEAFGRAIGQAPDVVPTQMQSMLSKAQARYAAWQEQQAVHLRRQSLKPSPALLAMIESTIRRAPPDREGPMHYCYPGLPEIPFHDRARFPWLDALEAATDVIAAEFEAVAAAEAAELVPYIQYPDSVPLDQWRALNRNRDWTAIHLIERGRVNAANAQHCPRTMELLRSIPQPEIADAGPNAMFSLLAPHTHIPPHTGIANTRLVCHLPLIVPPGCWFRVGDDRREWERRKAWVFDDTIEHEAMNPSDALRVILIVDCWHPDLSDGERADIGAVIAAGGQVHGL